MNPNSITPIHLLILGSGFLLVLSLWMAGVILWTDRKAAKARRIEQRLGMFSDSGEGRMLRLWHDGKEITTFVHDEKRRLSPVQSLARKYKETGWQMSAKTILGLLAASTAMLVMLVYIVSSNPPLAVVSGIAGVLLFWLFMNRSINKRSTLFERQFLDSLELAARSLRAGHPLVGSFRLVADEIPAPAGTVFDQVCQQQSLGMSLEVALRQAAEESGSQDMKLFATSVVIQMQSGGNLADMMERLAAIIRDRIRLSRRVRVLTAQTQFSKRVLMGLPVLLFLLLNLMNPKYMEPLYTTSEGKLLLVIAMVSLMIGAWMMNRMAVLKY